MRRRPFLLATAVLLLSATGTAGAVVVERVEIVGLDEEMTENVRVSLALVDAIGTDVGWRRFSYMLREAEAQTREALEPFGFYSPTITIEREGAGAGNGGAGASEPVRRDDDGDIGADGREAPGAGAPGASITIRVDPGQPVRVRNADIAIIGEGNDDRYLQQDLANFLPGKGSILNHVDYEASKTRISRRLTERGYFDADFSSRRVEVTRADFAADIDLVWTSGQRYDMGPTTIEQTRQIIRPDILENLIYWNEGEYYHQGRLDRLRTSLTRLDYFGDIDIEAQADQAIVMEDGSKRVPVKVSLSPAKRSIYTAGVSYGTDSGAGIRMGVERRYVNQRGHKALAQLDYAQRRKTLTLQYRVPAFAWRDGWYTISLQGYDEQTSYIDTRRLELIGSRSGQYSPTTNLVASIHALRERWFFEEVDEEGALAPEAYRYATFTYPSIRAEYVNVDDRTFPRSGIGGSLVLRGGLDSLGSNASFVQAHLRASWFMGIGDISRLIVRGEAGYTFTDALVDMPPSLRYYAGGDRSIRGYEWREVGPRVFTEGGEYAAGAKNVLTASVEYERYFLGNWGAAVFVDSGSAFDGRKPEWRTGVGIGARWRSPVGPLKFDIARGLDDPDSPFTIGLSIGAEF
ncbi:outer membrane protein assembly factor [Luteimonas aestuarii]|uniref:Translocation and assembly module subunit TamA n=1 Tax=Luteimonas aestuarii TaxID=453837 RepID=A0A4R5TMR0_9GAMM|nr:autotransporter assembly complex family protein [Luteimonas aestuarii]TDK19565.1 outer membrane protein assembly factor [Luteimonas aestuarii]